MTSLKFHRPPSCLRPWQAWQECEVLAADIQISLSDDPSTSDTSRDGSSTSPFSIVDFRKRKRLVDLSERIFVEDLAYALSKGAEQTLWNSGYKAFIDFFQSRVRQRKTETDAAVLQVCFPFSL